MHHVQQHLPVFLLAVSAVDDVANQLCQQLHAHPQGVRHCPVQVQQLIQLPAGKEAMQEASIAVGLQLLPSGHMHEQQSTPAFCSTGNMLHMVSGQRPELL
jgi:hypothetical protein